MLRSRPLTANRHRLTIAMEDSSQHSTPDSDGLAANRQGMMTPAQRSSIGIMLALDGGLVLGVGLVGLIVGRIVWVWRQVLPWQISVTIAVLAALLLLGISVWRLARLLSGWLDLSAGQVEQAEGRIVWMGKSYGAQIQGRRLRFIYGITIPPPADYGFFYLPRSGWILSIDRLASTGTQTDLYLLNALAHVINFSTESLKANRAGRLAKDQAWQLLVPMLGSCLAGLLMIGIAIAFIGYVLLHDLKSMALIIPIFFALAVMVGFYSWNGVTTIIPDVLAGRVAVAEGPVYKRKASTSGIRTRRTDYFYEINGRRFEVSPQAYKALFAGRSYRLYYTPYSKSIVSIEPLTLSSFCWETSSCRRSDRAASAH
jgi:hypothetical protein